MSNNILNDIVDEVTLKPSKTKLVLKWVLSISGTLILLAFTFGQFRSSYFGRLDKFEKSLDDNTKATIELKQDMNAGFDKVNARIDKVYDDGYKEFDAFQQYNSKQLGLIIDYGSSQKDLLKRMLEVNTMEKTKTVESNLQQAKSEQPNISIQVRPLNSKIGFTNSPYQDLLTATSSNDHDTTFTAIGATLAYINQIKKSNYIIGEINPSTKYSGLFDFTYKNKK
jgi:hypothetical protein